MWYVFVFVDYVETYYTCHTVVRCNKYASNECTFKGDAGGHLAVTLNK